jgi:hypothetical protein
MLRQDDPEATVAEGTLTETEAAPLPALALKRERVMMLGHKERLRLTRFDAGWLQHPLILILPTGPAGRLSPVSA